MENMDVTRRQFGSEYRSDSTNLRDLLLFSQNDTNETNQPNSEKRGGGNLDRIQSSRTLRDVIKEDHKESKNRKSSMSFKDRYIRRQGSGSGSGSEWVSSVPIPTSDVPLHPQNSFRNITRWDSTRKPDSDGSGHPNSDSGSSRLRSVTLQRNITIDRPRVRFEGLDDEPEEEDMTDEGEKENDKEDQDEDEDEDGGGSGGGGGGEGGGGEEAPVRMSLMSLLAETESGYAMDEDDEDDEEEGVGEYNNCCVCMVRHKGTAFIPCGHTFCRLCSRELWVQRGNCPLCNNFILEILDIY